MCDWRQVAAAMSAEIEAFYNSPAPVPDGARWSAPGNAERQVTVELGAFISRPLGTNPAPQRNTLSEVTGF